MRTMTVKIMTRPGTLNPQNRVVLESAQQMGYTNFSAIQIERCLRLEITDDVDVEELKGRLEKDLRRPEFAQLFNPVTDICLFECT